MAAIPQRKMFCKFRLFKVLLWLAQVKIMVSSGNNFSRAGQNGSPIYHVYVRKLDVLRVMSKVKILFQDRLNLVLGCSRHRQIQDFKSGVKEQQSALCRWLHSLLSLHAPIQVGRPYCMDLKSLNQVRTPLQHLLPSPSHSAAPPLLSQSLPLPSVLTSLGLGRENSPLPPLSQLLLPLLPFWINSWIQT